MAPRIGYVLNQYPAISHSFILREVRALRELGIEIDTYSIHRSDPGHVLAEHDREEYRRTYALRPVNIGTLVTAHLRAFRDRPNGYVRALRKALWRGRRGARELTWQLFYFLEAVPIWLEIKRAGLRHVHAHFTNPAADVAMIVSELWNGDEASSWSFSAHGADIEETDQTLLADKIRSAERVVCVSDYGRSQLMAIVEPEQWPKISVIHCGVDAESFPVRQAQSRNGRPLRILNVGRLVPVKGQAVLLEAIALIRRRGLDVAVTIVGDGPLRDSLQSIAHALEIEGCVEFAGSVGQDDIGAHYRGADLFCLPSLREGVPVVLMEAMATGVPVIASRIMGIPELIEDEVTGLLVPPGRADALADAIIRLAGDVQLCNRMVAAARGRITAEYEVRGCARQLASVLARAVADGGSPPVASAGTS
jgi:colanic acid/amylovoran biosynthesis glycosyltransferase